MRTNTLKLDPFGTGDAPLMFFHSTGTHSMPSALPVQSAECVTLASVHLQHASVSPTIHMPES